MSHPVLKIKIPLFSAAIFGITTAQADLIFSGDFTKSEGQLELTEELNFDITSTGYLGLFSFDDIVPVDANQTDGGDLDFSLLINDLPISSELVTFFDNLSNTVGDLNSSDSYMPFDGFVDFEVFAGDVLTIEADTWTGLGHPDFNPDYNSVGTFFGDVRLASLGGETLALSQLATIPEPSALSLFAFVRRRR